MNKCAAILAAPLILAMGLAIGPSSLSAQQQPRPTFSADAAAERIPNLDTLKKELKEYHDCTCRCGCYAHDLDALKALHELHDAPGAPKITMAVLTNKPVRPARGICEGLGLANYFLHIYGGDSFPLKKPDPLGLRSLMDETGATPDETVMIGDSKVDVETARNAGAWSVLCAFGFGPQNLSDSPPDVLVDTAAEWTQALNPSVNRPK